MPIRVVSRTASTQEDLLRLVAEDARAWPHLSGLRAIEQFAGRGRSGRSWRTAGVRALTVSFVLRPPAPTSAWSGLALRAGVAAVQALAGIGVSSALKWPNDIVIDTAADVPGWHGIAKVGGVLGSLATDSTGEQVCIMGIGINLQGTPPLATAASVESPIDAGELAHAIRDRLARVVPGQGQAPELADLLTPHLHTLRREVIITFPGDGEGPATQIRGRATGVGPDGALLVQTPDGPRRVLTGDVAHTRLAGADRLSI